MFCDWISQHWMRDMQGLNWQERYSSKTTRYLQGIVLVHVVFSPGVDIFLISARACKSLTHTHRGTDILFIPFHLIQLDTQISLTYMLWSSWLFLLLTCSRFWLHHSIQIDSSHLTDSCWIDVSCISVHIGKKVCFCSWVQITTNAQNKDGNCNKCICYSVNFYCYE